MILYYSLTTLYVLVCLMLLLVILLQQGKGGDMASAFGGGSSQTAFGARAGATLMTKLTTIFAVLFMVLALALAILGQRGPGSLVSGTAGSAAGGQARDSAGRASDSAGHAGGPCNGTCSSPRGSAAAGSREIGLVRDLGLSTADCRLLTVPPDVTRRTSQAAVPAESSVDSPDRPADPRAGFRRACSTLRRSRRERRRRRARWRSRPTA